MWGITQTKKICNIEDTSKIKFMDNFDDDSFAMVIKELCTNCPVGGASFFVWGDLALKRG